MCASSLQEKGKLLQGPEGGVICDLCVNSLDPVVGGSGPDSGSSDEVGGSDGVIISDEVSGLDEVGGSDEVGGLDEVGRSDEVGLQKYKIIYRG